MDEEQRLNFNSFVDAYNAYQNPNLAPVAPAFAGYGYEAPQLNMVQAPNQLPPMSINPDAIYDPTVGAAMQILNRPMMMAQVPNLLGAGTDYQTQFGLLKDIAPVKLQQYQKIAPPPPPRSLMESVGTGDRLYGGDREAGNNGVYDMGFGSQVSYDYGLDPLSVASQNYDLLQAGWSPMGYDDGGGYSGSNDLSYDAGGHV